MKNAWMWFAAGMLVAAAGCKTEGGARGGAIPPKAAAWDGAEWITGGISVPADDAGFYNDSPMPVLKRAFTTRGRVKCAWLQIAGLGYYDAFLNGQRLTSTAFPLLTPYAKRVLFDRYDVTGLLAAGENTLTVELGNGWYNPLPMKMWGTFNLRAVMATGVPCAKAKLVILYKDGTTEEIPTDANWLAAPGPVVRNSLYLGETYDARRRPETWAAAKAVPGPSGRLEERTAPPVAVRESWAAKSIQQLKPGVWIADMGVNFGGMARYTLRGGKAGTAVKFRYGELQNKNGSVNVMTAVAGQIKRAGMGGPGAPALAEQCDTYICGGAAEESFEPRLAFHSFRYIQIEGDIAAPLPGDVVALACSSAVADIGEFKCSDEKLNELNRVCLRTFRSNLMGVQSDCPAREKFGYGADIGCTVDALFLSFDMAEFYAKTVRDFLDEASDDGWFTETAPYVGIGDRGQGKRSGPVGWTVGVPIVVDALYRYAGDKAIVAESYPACVRYLELLRGKYPDLIIPYCIGDHEALDKAPTDLTATAHFHQWAALTAKFARILGKDGDAAKCDALAADIRAAFQKKFVQGGKVGPCSEGAQAFGLWHGLVADDDRDSAYSLLKSAVAAKGDAVSTGIYSTKYILDLLSRNGDAELAGKLVTHKGFPGWMNMLDRGATTLWENWAGSDNTYSQNHPMFGSVNEWIMAELLGISVPEDAVGCDKIRIAPHAVAGVTWAEGSYRTPRGTVRVSWKLVNGKINVTSRVPAGIQVVE